MKKIVILIVYVTTIILTILLPSNKVHASSKITLSHEITEDLINNQTYYLNGFRYTYNSSNERLTASISNTPQIEKLAVFYNIINDKTVFYPSDLNLVDYTILEDVIVFNELNVGTILNGKTLNNLYMANQNRVMNGYPNFSVDNYHFIAGYRGISVDITGNYLNNFNNMSINNTYYYSWNEIFFKQYADKYNDNVDNRHHFELGDEGNLNYTKESFYPSRDFVLNLEQSGIKYYRHTISSVIEADTKIGYYAYEVDSRVKSLTAPLLYQAGILTDIEFNTLDVRGYPLGSLISLKANTGILTNSSSSFNTMYINFKNVYLVYDETKPAISSVSTTGTIRVEKIYINEDEKEHFSAIINNEELKDKVKYYEGSIKTDFVFTNTDGNKTYKSSNDFINIDETLSLIEELESDGIEIPEDIYINELLEEYFPNELEEPDEPIDTEVPDDTEEQIDTEEPTENLYNLSIVFLFTRNIDIKKAIELMKPYMLSKNGYLTNEEYTLEINYDELSINKLTFIVTYPNGISTSYTTNYYIIDSSVGEFFGCHNPDLNNFKIMVEATTIKPGIKASDLLNIYINKFLEETPNINQPITLTKTGISQQAQTTINDNLTITAQTIVVKEDLNHQGFVNPYKTLEDEYGKAGFIEEVKDKLENNNLLKIILIALSSIIGFIIMYIIYKLLKKFFKWLK